MEKNNPKSDKIEIRRLSRVVEDLRYLHGGVAHTLDTVRNRALALLGGEITIITFLFTSGKFNFMANDHAASIYGWIFFSLGSIILVGSLLGILWIMHPVHVTVPPDTKDTKNMAERFCDNEVKYLRYMKSEFENSIESLVVSISRRADIFAWTVRLIPVAIFIMVVLKYL